MQFGLVKNGGPGALHYPLRKRDQGGQIRMPKRERTKPYGATVVIHEAGSGCRRFAIEQSLVTPRQTSRQTLEQSLLLA